MAAAALAACGDGGEPPRPTAEAVRTPFPPKRLPVDEAAARLRDALDECLGREGLSPAKLEGIAQILRDAGAQSPGGVAIDEPTPSGTLHVVYTPPQARAVVRGTRHLKMASRGRVVYQTRHVPAPVRERVLACIDEAERAAPVAR